MPFVLIMRQGDGWGFAIQGVWPSYCDLYTNTLLILKYLREDTFSFAICPWLCRDPIPKRGRKFIQFKLYGKAHFGLTVTPNSIEMPLPFHFNTALQSNIFHACRFHPKHHQRQLWRPRCIALACNLIYAIHPLVPTQSDISFKITQICGWIGNKCIDSKYSLDVPIPINIIFFYNMIWFSSK